MDGKYKNLPWTLAKELSQTQSRPSWESRNEGIHERISFDDTIWGFNLAGGAYYDTPLRVTQVKENSRADKAGIKVGDVLRFINDFDTSLLTLQQAHDLILQSGIEIKLKLSAPDVDEPYHYTYEDEILQELREMKRKKDEESKKKRKPFKGAKTNSEWSYAWPCNKKREVMYRESNCFLIPSKYEEKMQLIKEKKKLQEDRAVAHINKEKMISMMKTQNAYHIMDSDEEIEPQYLELLHKNTEETNEIVNNVNSKEDYKINFELPEDLYTPDINLDENQESNNQSYADVFKNHTDEEKVYEKEDSNSDSNELLINDDRSKLVKNDGELQNKDCVKKEDEFQIVNENEIFFLDNSLNSLIFIDNDLSKEKSKNTESGSGNENYDDNEEIDLKNKTRLNGKDETQLSDEEFCFCDDDDIFHEELVILDESEINSDSLSDENNEELVLQDISK